MLSASLLSACFLLRARRHKQESESPRFSIIVHGGAYNIADEACEASIDGCRAAAEKGLAVLRGGGTAVQAVEAAILSLEDNPLNHLKRSNYQKFF